MPPVRTEGPDPICPPGDIWEMKLTFSMYINILLDIKDIRDIREK